MKKLLILGLSALTLVGCGGGFAAQRAAKEGSTKFDAALPLCPDVLGRTDPASWKVFEAALRAGKSAPCKCPSGRVNPSDRDRLFCATPTEHVVAARLWADGKLPVPWGQDELPTGGPRTPDLSTKPDGSPRPATLPTLDR